MPVRDMILDKRTPGTFAPGVLSFLGKAIHLRIDIPPSVHNAYNIDRMGFMVRDVEHQIIVHLHDTQASAAPRLFIVQAEPIRHITETSYTILEPRKLTGSILDRLQVVSDVRKDVTQVILGLLGDFYFKAHTP